MSYSFNWDCTLPITNIQDIVSINIVPETQSYNEGDYLSIRGHISIDGEYVSSTGEQNVFKESIPLDITLPNTGRNGEIKLDVTNFDYDIEDDGKLCLDLNLSIGGYDLDSIPTLVEETVETPKEQAPILFTKEAIVSHPMPQSPQAVEVSEANHHSAFIDTDNVDYLDFDDVAMPSHQDAIELIAEEEEGRQETVELINEEEEDCQEVVELVNEEEEDRQEVVELVDEEEEDRQEVVELVDEEEEDRQEVVELVDEEEEDCQEVVELVDEEEEDRQEVVELVDEGEEDQEVVELVDEGEEVHHNKVVDEIERKEKLTDKIKQLIKKEPVVESNLIQEAVVIESQPVSVEAVIEEHPIVEEVSTSQPIVEEIIVEAEPIVEKPKAIVKPKPVMPIPIVIPVVEPQVEQVIEEEEEIEILPFPLKTSSSVIIQPQPTVVDKSNIFDMLYELDEEEIEVVQEEAPFVETIVIPTAVPQPVVHQVVTPTPQPAVQQVVTPTPQPAVQQVVTPTSQPAVQQVVTPTPQPVVQQVVTPTPQPVVQQVVTPTPQPVVQQVVTPTPQPAVQQVVTPTPQPAVQQVVTPTPQPTVEEVSATPTMYDDSVASQFADGESIIKIVFIQEEEFTLADLVTKYSIQEENVYNCNNLNFPLCQGDRVMINYGSYRGR